MISPGFKGSTLIRTPNGFVAIKDLKYGLIISTMFDSQYEFVNTVNCERTDSTVAITIGGLPETLITSPSTFVAAISEPELSPKIERLPASVLRDADLVVCPFRKKVEAPYGCLFPVLEYSRFLGMYLGAGNLQGETLVFEMPTHPVYEEVLRITDQYDHRRYTELGELHIHDEKLVRAVQYMFGISGTGALSANVLNLDRSAKFVFLGGFIDACGFTDKNGRVHCPFTHVKNGMQLLELLWNTGTTAAILRPEPPAYHTYTLIIEKTPFLEETSNVLPSVPYVREFPFVKVTSDWAYLKPTSIKLRKRDNDVLYSIQTAWSSSYVAGMVAVNGSCENANTRKV